MRVARLMSAASAKQSTRWMHQMPHVLLLCKMMNILRSSSPVLHMLQCTCVHAWPCIVWWFGWVGVLDP